VGPVTIKAIDPGPLYGGQIARRELDPMDKQRPEAHRVRNGFMLNPAARTRSMPRVERFVHFTQRPWVGTFFFGFEEPVENMPQLC